MSATTKQAQQPEWLTTFAIKLLERGAEVPLATTIIAAAVADALYLAHAIGLWLTAVRDFGPNGTAALEVLAGGSGNAPFALPGFTAPPLPAASAPLPAVVPVTPGALDRIFKLVQVIKSSTGYTNDIGLALGVVGSASPVPGPADKPSPVVKVEAGATNTDPQRARITYKKHGHMGAAVYGHRGSGAGALEFLGVNTTGVFLDERPLLVAGQPEVRQYELRFWDKGAEVGEPSDTVTVTVGP